MSQSGTILEMIQWVMDSIVIRLSPSRNGLCERACVTRLVLLSTTHQPKSSYKTPELSNRNGLSERACVTPLLAQAVSPAEVWMQMTKQNEGEDFKRYKNSRPPYSTVSADDGDDSSVVAEDIPEDPSALPAVASGAAHNNTMCYNFVLQRDGCVPSSTDWPCSGDPANTANYIGTFDTKPAKRWLGRRYDTGNTSVSIHGGVGICGPYDTTTTSGVCLWSGSNWLSGADPKTAGWLNGAATGNCGKQIYIQRQNQPETMQLAPVIDGCNFWTTQPEVGCSQIWMTQDLFNKFGPTEEESRKLIISSTFTWNFNNIDGGSPENAPL